MAYFFEKLMGWGFLPAFGERLSSYGPITSVGLEKNFRQLGSNWAPMPGAHRLTGFQK
jgi:hypothetical protein